MQVILLERVEKLGQMGDEVKVKSGFARNYLLPKKKALRATKANREFFQTQKAQLEARNLERKSEAEKVAKTLDGKVPYEISVTLARAVDAAARDAEASGLKEPVVLLSPACASFDQYPNFEVRGKAFTDLVRAIPGVVALQ